MVIGGVQELSLARQNVQNQAIQNLGTPTTANIPQAEAAYQRGEISAETLQQYRNVAQQNEQARNFDVSPYITRARFGGGDWSNPNLDATRYKDNFPDLWNRYPLERGTVGGDRIEYQLKMPYGGESGARIASSEQQIREDIVQMYPQWAKSQLAQIQVQQQSAQQMSNFRGTFSDSALAQATAPVGTIIEVNKAQAAGIITPEQVAKIQYLQSPTAQYASQQEFQRLSASVPYALNERGNILTSTPEQRALEGSFQMQTGQTFLTTDYPTLFHNIEPKDYGTLASLGVSQPILETRLGETKTQTDLYHQAGWGVMTPQGYAEKYGLPYASQPQAELQQISGLENTWSGKQSIKLTNIVGNVNRDISEWQSKPSGYYALDVGKEAVGGLGKGLVGLGSLIPASGLFITSFIESPRVAAERLSIVAPEAISKIPSGMYEQFANPVSEKGWIKGTAEDIGIVGSYIIGGKAIGKAFGSIKGGSVEVGTKVVENLPFENNEFYHGTPTKNVANIMKEGIVPNLPEGAKIWSGQNPYESIYLTKNYETALKYATNAGENEGTVFKVELSPEQMSNIKYLGTKMAGWEFEGKASPEQINIIGKPTPLWKGIYTDVKESNPIIGVGPSLENIGVKYRSGFWGSEESGIALFALKTQPIETIEVPKPNIIAGMPKPEQLPYIDIGRTEITTGIEKTILTNPTIMEKYGYYTPQEVAKVNIGGALLGRVEKIDSKFIEKTLPAETKATSQAGMNEFVDYAKEHEEQLKQVYGSTAAYNQLNPEYRVGGIKEMISRPSDVDIQLTDKPFKTVIAPQEAFVEAFSKSNIEPKTIDVTTESGKYAQGLLERLQKVGEPVAIEPEKPTLIVTTKEGLPSHAFDIHSGEIQQAGEVAPEGVFGYKYGQKSIQMSELPTMKLSEQAMRKIGSTLTLQSFSKAQLEEYGLLGAFKEMYGEKDVYKGFFPELHRMKDIAHIRPIGYSLAESTMLKESKIKGLTDEYIKQFGGLYDITKNIPEPPSPKPSYPLRPTESPFVSMLPTTKSGSEAIKEPSYNIVDPSIRSLSLITPSLSGKEVSTSMSIKESPSRSLVSTPPSRGYPSFGKSPSQPKSSLYDIPYPSLKSPPPSRFSSGSSRGGGGSPPYVPPYTPPSSTSFSSLAPKYYPSSRLDVPFVPPPSRLDFKHPGISGKVKSKRDTDFFFGFRESPIMPAIGKGKALKAGTYKFTLKDLEKEKELF